jgi:hypothetical protein
MKFKQILGVATALMMAVGVPNSVRAEGTKEIQLTDYRYESCMRGLYGYVFSNIKASSENNDVYGTLTSQTKPCESEDVRVIDSVILKPDGSELFQQGQYGLKYVKNGWYSVIDSIGFPQCDSWFVARDNSTPKMWCLIDANGNKISSFNAYDRTGLLGIYDNKYAVVGSATFENADTQGDADYSVDFDALIRLSDGKVIINVTEEPVKDPAELYVSTDKKYFMVRGIGWTGTKDSGQRQPFTETSYFDLEGNEISEPPDVEFENCISKEEYLDIDENGSLHTDKVDRSYVIKSKDIGDKTYYAVFKQLTDGESVADYTPKEQPSTWATDSISKATSEGLLYNNANCRYKDNISRQDFCILAVEAYCKSQGMEVDDYIKANNITLDYNQFTDTDNAYVLLANKLGIVSGTSDTTFSPDRGITRQEAAVLLNNIASLCELKPNSEKASYTDEAKFATWAKDAIYNVSNIQNSDGVAIMNGMEENHFSPWSLYSREQAYVTIYRLYEMCNQK